MDRRLSVDVLTHGSLNNEYIQLLLIINLIWLMGRNNNFKNVQLFDSLL